MTSMPRIHPCAMCARQSEAAARLVYVDLALLATPYLVTALGLWVFARHVRQLMRGVKP